METFYRIILLAIVAFVIYAMVKDAKKKKKQEIEEKNWTPSDEDINRATNNFKDKIAATYLPDSLPGQEVYIFQKFMSPWFEELSGQYRYDDVMSRKIRLDWLEYIDCRERARTHIFLAGEAYGKDENKVKEYQDNIIKEVGAAHAIENAFASAIGGDALKNLEIIRNMATWSFSQSGEIAPEGYQYISDELVKINK